MSEKKNPAAPGGVSRADDFNVIAAHGGAPCFPDGPPAWPMQDDEVKAALEDVYQSGDWGRYEGPRLELLSNALCELTGAAFGLPCSSGTVAVELALRGLKIPQGREVILASYDFAGNFRAIDEVGGRVVLVDIDPSTCSLDPEQVEAALGPQTSAIIASHLHGGLAPMRRLRELADHHQVALVEDACQSVGGFVDGQPVGSWGDVATLSFGGSKLLSAGRGGMVLTSHPEIRQRIIIASQQGNHAYPLSELQAAVLLPQVKKLPERNAIRLSRALELVQLIAELPLHAIRVESGARDRSAMFRLGLHLEEACTASRRQVAAAMRAEGIALDPGFRGFANRGETRCRKVGELPNGKLAAQRMLLLHHAHLLEPSEHLKKMVCAIGRVLNALNRAP